MTFSATWVQLVRFLNNKSLLSPPFCLIRPKVMALTVMEQTIIIINLHSQPTHSRNRTNSKVWKQISLDWQHVIIRWNGFWRICSVKKRGPFIQVYEMFSLCNKLNHLTGNKPKHFRDFQILYKYNSECLKKICSIFLSTAYRKPAVCGLS